MTCHLWCASQVEMNQQCCCMLSCSPQWQCKFLGMFTQCRNQASPVASCLLTFTRGEHAAADILCVPHALLFNTLRTDVKSSDCMQDLSGQYSFQRSVR